MKRISLQFCMIALATLAFAKPACVTSASTETIVSPSTEQAQNSLSARTAIVRITVVLEAGASGITASLAEAFCHPTGGQLSIDWKLYGAPEGSTGQGTLLELKTTEEMACAQGVSFDYQNTQPMVLKAVVTIYDLGTSSFLAYGISNTTTAP